MYTAIEAVGLVVSLAFVILIGTYVWQQYSTAYSHPDHDRIYAVHVQDFFGMSFFDKEDIDMNIPEVELSTRYGWYNDYAIKVNDIFRSDVSVMNIDKEFFEMFPQTFLEGSPDVLEDVSNVVVTRSFANSIATDGQEVLGKSLLITGQEDKPFYIAGIIEDFSGSMIPATDIIVNVEIHRSNFEGMSDRYGSIGQFSTLFRVAEGTNRMALEEKVIGQFLENYTIWASQSFDFEMDDLDELYFYDKIDNSFKHTNLSTLRMLVVIVLALLISAVMNYVNLTFALSGKRSKEMATRRLVGAGKADVFAKNILESVLFTIVCFALATVLAYVLQPMMNSLLGLREDIFTPISIKLTPGYVLTYIAVSVLLGAVAGFIPSLHASHFKPIDIIKGAYRRRSKMLFSKVFIVVQNTLSVILISMAVLMEAQLSHMVSRPLNAETENLFHMRVGSARTVSDIIPLIDRLEAIPEVLEVGVGNGVPCSMNMTVGTKNDKDEHVSIRANICDSVYMRMLAPHIVKDFGHQAVGSIWLSESAANAMNLSDSIEARILRQIGNINGTKVEYIGGIIKDIPAGTLSDAEASNVAFYVQNHDNMRYMIGLLIHTTEESEEIKDKIMAAFEDYERERNIPGEAWVADYISDIVASGLAPAVRTIRLVEIFMFLAVILSVLGLVAMSTYFSEQKSKEIAVRKVFGGTILSETWHNVRSYMLLVLTACVIGLPIAVYAAQKYLERFAYRIDGIWWIFVIAVLLTFILSLASVLWQVTLAARTNPAVELKKE